MWVMATVKNTVKAISISRACWSSNALMTGLKMDKYKDLLHLKTCSQLVHSHPPHSSWEAVGSAGTVADEHSYAAVTEIADGSTVAVLSKSSKKKKKASLKGLWLMLLSYGGLMPRGNVNRKGHNYCWLRLYMEYGCRPVIRLLWPEKRSEVTCPLPSMSRHEWRWRDHDWVL